MSDSDTTPAEAAQDWPLRPWLLAGLLGAAGLLIHLVTRGHPDVGWRAAVAAFLFFGSISAALSTDRDDWRAPAIFSVVLGLVMAGLAWRAVQYGESLPDEQYGFGAGVIASLLALPLFQAGFLRRRFATPYADAHYHVWNDALAGAGAIAFTGLSWLVLLILSELFHLLKIDLIRDLMNEEWFAVAFSGTAFGAALGTLKNQAKVLGTLQSVAMLVLSLLAVPLAFGLAAFLVATVLSGPQVLWDATRSATPVLLICAAGAFGLTNAVIRAGDAEMTRNRVLRAAAMVLAAVILPLALFAALSMGLRLRQYGLAPERLWGLVAIAVACAFGLAYWVALVRGRLTGWAESLRRANLHLAAAVCVLAIVLALPILDFGAISTRNQISRLESGTVAPQRFDFNALRWDFGAAGRRALARLAEREDDAGKRAKEALAQQFRPWNTGVAEVPVNLRVAFQDPALEKSLRAAVARQRWLCTDYCVALDAGKAANGSRHVVIVGSGSIHHHYLPENGDGASEVVPAAPALPKIGADTVVDIGPAQVRRIYIDGKPVGEPFE